MIKFTAVSVVLYLLDMFLVKLYLGCSEGASFRLALNELEKGEKVWFCIAGWWAPFNVILVTVCIIRLIFMYL